MRYGQVSSWACRARERGRLCLVLLCVVGVASCQAAQPTPTPRLPDERELYAMMTDRYTSWDVIYQVQSMSAGEASRMLMALQAIHPPSGLESLHEQSINAYQHICSGTLLLPGADSVLRSEARFMVDWGMACLIEYREQLELLLHPQAQNP
jgi:hypothetical protein